MIVIIDFGSQTTHLISRRLSDFGIETSIIEPEDIGNYIKKNKPTGIIFSGGPSSVYGKDAPLIDKRVFSLNVPILGICYGLQLISYLLGGKVAKGKVKEYGSSRLIVSTSKLFKGIQQKYFNVWMSHGDEVLQLPNNFKSVAKTDNIPNATIENKDKKIYGVQFHPEVEHTEHGKEILKNFAIICGEKISSSTINIDEIINNIRSTVKNNTVIIGFSGGTDSFVTGGLIAKAIGKQLIPVFVDSGLSRIKTDQIKLKTFYKLFGIKPVVINAKKIFIESLKGVLDPERKRKIIGRTYIKIFEKYAKSNKNISFLAQGTTYADFIHSKGTKHSAVIKSHHNVGGLPKKMKLKLLEPLKYYYTDQVRQIGSLLNLPESIIYQQPFPGPGFAVRIIGEITKERVKMIQTADSIVVEEIENNKLNKDIFQYFAILTGTKSTAIKGDHRFYGEVVAIRAYTSKDRMTANIAQIPYEILQKISTRIVNEVPGVSRVVYDITTKPPATMEWE